MSRVNLDIMISNKSEFFSKYNEKTLNRGLKEYMLNELVGYSEDAPLKIKIKTKYNLSEEDKKNYMAIIRKEFRENYIDLKHDAMKDYKKSIILIMMGVMLLVIGFAFLRYNDSLLAEIFNIGGWLLMWESGYEIIYTLADRKKEMKRYNQIVLSQIEFIDK